jgi:hypothetical protein
LTFCVCCVCCALCVFGVTLSCFDESALETRARDKKYFASLIFNNDIFAHDSYKVRVLYYVLSMLYQ